MADPIRIFALHCGGDVCDRAAFDPFDAAVGTKVYNPYFIYVITHPKGNVLFDSGAHPDLRVDPVARLGPAGADFEVKLSADDHLEACLARIDMTPKDIDYVVQSHLHFDHAGGLPWLTHAPVFVQREELEFASDPPPYQESVYVAADFEGDHDWQQLDGDHDLFGDGRLMILSTPGHTRGHQSLLVKLAGQTVILLADATYLLEKMRARALPAVIWSPDAIIATWERIEELEREHDARLLPTHELDFRDSVRIAPGGWYE